MENAEAKKVLWGEEFHVVPEGLAEDEVVSFVDDLMEQSRQIRDDQERQASLHRLAEQTVVEADKLAASIKQQARGEAEAEAARLIAAADAGGPGAGAADRQGRREGERHAVHRLGSQGQGRG